jgi:hypothetical protein
MTILEIGGFKTGDVVEFNGWLDYLAAHERADGEDPDRRPLRGAHGTIEAIEESCEDTGDPENGPQLTVTRWCVVRLARDGSEVETTPEAFVGGEEWR